MLIYCDGGCKTTSHNRVIISWGICIEDGSEKGVELMGARVLGQEYKGVHELVAFAEAVIYAKAHNGNTLNTKFVTDYKNLVRTCTNQAHLYVTDTHIQGMLYRIRKLYSPQTLADIEQFLIFANIRWVKAHRGVNGCVNHNRADYLARVARELIDSPKKCIMSFDKWLTVGMNTYHGDVQALEFYPFC